MKRWIYAIWLMLKIMWKNHRFEMYSWFATVLIIAFCLFMAFFMDCGSPKCVICGEWRASNQRGKYWLCNNCSSIVATQARIELGLAYSIKKHGYIETDKRLRDKELEIIGRYVGE